MCKTCLTARDNSPRLVAARIAEILATYQRAGGLMPAKLMVHPLTWPRLDNAIIRRLLARSGVRLEIREIVEPQTLRLRPTVRVYA